MHDLLALLHLAAAVLWMGGMGFMILALRPALAALLPPPSRLPVIAAVLRRFFAVVIASIVLLLATGVPLLRAAHVAPKGWHAMAGIGVLMMLVFAYLWFSPYARLKRAVANEDWPAGGRAVQGIHRLAQLNFVLGWIAIAAVMLWH